MGTSKTAAALTLLLAALAAPAGLQVTFHDGKPVHRAEILLSDIADIKGDSAELVTAVSGLKIGKAALPGYNRRFDTERVFMTYLAPYRRAGADIAVSGPRDIMIETASRTLDGVLIAETLRKQIYEKATFARDKIQVTFTSVPDQVILPDTECALTLEPQEDCDWRGSELMNVAVRSGGLLIKKFPVSLRFRVFETVCVADNKIKRGQVLTAAEIRTEIREITDVTDRIFLKPSELLGKQTQQTVLFGTVFTDANVNDPPLVRKGERVRIVIREKSAQVEVDGIAKEDGAMGARIRVRSGLSQKLVTGFVCGEGEVSLSGDYNGGIL